VANKARLEYFKNKFEKKRCFIIGNGPSLNSTDLTTLKDEITFGVNCIFYHFDKMGFKPTFYVVEDTLVAEDRAQEINSLKGMNKIFGSYLKYCLEDDEDVIWCNVKYEWDYQGFPRFSKDAGQHIWVGGTVSYLCMQLAYYMGFENVYLIGFDHNYDIPEDADRNGTIITSASSDQNHFHPEYFGKGKRWHDPRLDRMEKAYIMAKNVFNEDGRGIYNATIGSKLKIFPKVDYEKIFLANSDAEDTKKPYISVILCTYRNPEFLKDVLKDLHNQTLDNDMYEIIAVDNSSQDETKSVISKYPAVKYLLEENIGLSNARNTGLQNAKGEIIVFTDDDTRIEPNWLEELLKVYKSYPDAWVVGGKILPIWDAPKPDWIKKDMFRSLSLIDYGESTRELIWPERNIGANISFKKKVFEKFCFFSTLLGRKGKSSFVGLEEVELQHLLYLCRKRIFYTPHAVIRHHVPQSRMTKQYFKRRAVGHLLILMALELKALRYETLTEYFKQNIDKLVFLFSLPGIFTVFIRLKKRFFNKGIYSGW
jgi:glycosyltransferase involved in cell wall biosynthesis